MTLAIGLAVATHSQAEAVAGAVLTTEVDSVLSGGLDVGSRSLSNLDLTAHWQGDNGWEAFGYILGDFGGPFSGAHAGDIQTTSNIDSVEGWRLFEAYGKKTFRKDSYVMAGLINLNGIFDVQTVGGLFLNASHGIGVDYSQIGLSIFPTSSLGIVGQWRFDDRNSFRAGIFDAVPGNPNDDKAFAYIRLSRREGSHIVGEYQYDFDGGYLKLAAWHNSAAAERLDGSGWSDSNSGAYAQLAVTLTGDDTRGLKGWLRTGIANAQVMTIDQYAGGGLVYTAPFKGRDTDQVGFAVAAAHFGKPYQTAIGDVLKGEITYELTYRWDIRDGLSIQPDLQYISHPYGRSDINDATVFNLRLKTDLTALR
ncbi:carbohydrate porin [Asticcacaulis sp. 201]|uniref:carbohydrate porin n=1 Tax=Asticcacaulis sp. 201 TaxID=3028787 RepID=UPI00291652ED|nr:carbohydrate porin [Asticcacaulis sp. 201]MDV6332904.1 carbohydrate porin [Asticcacaulis sp. 201]